MSNPFGAMREAAGIMRKTSWRMVVCLFLLTWIFHSIFLAEARQFALGAGIQWDSLSRLGQWELAWTRGPGALWRTLQLVSPAAFLLSLIFMGLTILLGMIRWKAVLQVQGLKLTFFRTAEISLVAHFFNSFLLGSTGGDLLKAYYAAQETHHKKTEAVMTVLVDRLLGLLAMLFFACLMMLPNYGLLMTSGRLTAISGIILVMFAGCLGLVLLSFWGGLSRRWPKPRQWLRNFPKGETLERALEACREYGRSRRFLLHVFSISMLLNLFCVLQIWSLARGMSIEVPFRALLVIVPMIVCLSAVPITPSGLGVRENLYVLALTVPALGVDPTLALSLSLLAYAGSLIWSVIGGVVYALKRRQHHLPGIEQAEELDHQTDNLPSSAHG